MAKKNGFTLIELLAVIIILGILMMIAIPSVSNYIINSRKSAYVSIISGYQSGVSQKINGLEYSFFDEDTTYYVHVANVSMEKGGDSPFGKWEEAYVVVTYNGSGYDYYWTGVDESGYKVQLKQISEITTEDIINDSEKTISKRRAVGERGKIVIIDKDGNMIEDTATLEYTQAEAEQCYIYSVKNNEVTIVKYKNTCSKDVEIPSMIAGYPVTTIGSQSFRNFGITSVEFPNTIVTIKNESFALNKITELKFPSSLKSLETWAFLSNQLTELPDLSMVTSLGSGVFSNNKFDELNAYIYARNSDGTENYTTILGYAGSGKDLIIPAEKNGVQLTTIASSAFRNVPLNTVVLPEGLKIINSWAFSGCGLKSINIPSTVTRIGEVAFANNNLTSINIPSTVTYVGTRSFNVNKFSDEDAFIYARKNDGTIDYSTIVSYAGANRSNVVIPATKNSVDLKKIDSYAFYGASLKKVSIPTTVTNIGSQAFNGNSLSDEDAFIYKRNSDGSIDYSTIIGYGGSNRKNVVIPAEKNGVKLKVIGNYAFSNNGITNVVLPEGLEKIGNYAFSVCKLTEVTIPSTVTEIGPYAFYKVDNYSQQNMLTKIINKTGRSFNWKDITGGNTEATFVIGIIRHPFGNISVTNK